MAKPTPNPDDFDPEDADEAAAADIAPGSLKGKLLIASERLGDPNFARGVVLIVQHAEGGALGLVLNHPVSLTLAQLRDKISADPLPDPALARDGDVFRGGPCEGPLMVLHGDHRRGGSAVVDAVWFTGERDIIEALLREPAAAATPARFFAGYSGWTAGQLETELSQGAWVVAPARADVVFAPPTSLWVRARTELVLGRDLPEAVFPDDPSVN